MQSYDFENENENITFIDETNIYSPLHIKTIAKEKYKLNKLQAISFEIFIPNTTNNQSLQYVEGAIGIGKTKIIWSIQDYFLKTGKQEKLRVTTYIANATLLINGAMIHFLLGLLIDKHTTTSKPNSIINIGPNIQFIIIDELSMVGCTLLATTHLKLQKKI